MDLSIVIPLLNEAESLPELHRWIVKVMNEQGYDYEILFVDDGSTDSSWKVIGQLQSENARVKGIRFLTNFGKSQALHAGFAQAQGDIVFTMDADLQDSPEEIPAMIALLQQGNYDLVSGWKKKRYDSVFAKNLPSKLFNWAARKTSGLELNDFNCGLKAYRHQVVKNIEVYGEMHRYIPVLAKNAGFGRIGEKAVKHQARKFGETKFGMNRFINGFLDLITLWFFSRFGKQPMHLFGLLGTIMFLIGFFSAGYIGASKLYRLYANIPSGLVTDNPWFYIALTTMLLGTMLFLSGFLGELVIRTQSHAERYRIAEKLNIKDTL